MAIPYINEITMPSKRKPQEGTCIDNIFVKSNNLEIKSFKYLSAMPDHYPLLVTIDLSNKLKNRSDQYMKVSHKKMLKLCNEENWYSILEIDDLNKALDTLISKIQNIIANSTTKINKKNNKNSIPRKNWITPGI